MNPKRLASTMLGIVQEWVQPAFKAVADRFDALERRFDDLPQAVKGDKGEKGDDADPELVRQVVAQQLAEWPRPKDGEPGKPADEDAIVASVLAKIPKPKDGEPGKDAEPIHPDTLLRMVSEEVRRQVDAIPRPQDGKDAKIDLEWLERLITLQIQTRFDAMPKPKDGEPGKSADMDALRIYACDVAEAAVAALPKPKDGEPGKAVELETVREMVRAEVAEIPAASPGKDGENATDEQVLRVAEPVIARMVALIPPPAKGEPGTKGERGNDADPAVLQSAVDAAVERLNQDFFDFVEEVTYGLENALPDLRPSSELRVNVNMPSPDPAGVKSSARDMVVLGNILTKQLNEVLSRPIKPIYDEKGRLVGAQRVAPS